MHTTCWVRIESFAKRSHDRPRLLHVLEHVAAAREVGGDRSVLREERSLDARRGMRHSAAGVVARVVADALVATKLAEHGVMNDFWTRCFADYESESVPVPRQSKIPLGWVRE